MSKINLLAISVFLLSILCSSAVQCQTYLNVHKKDNSVTKVATSEIDSVTHEIPDSKMLIHKKDNSLVQIPLADIDSITHLQESLSLFQLNQLPEIRLEVPLEQWNRLLQNFDTNPKNEEYVLAHYIFRQGTTEVRLDSMAIRIRGNTSRRRPEGNTGELHNPVTPDWHHAHFALKFDKYRKPQRFNGLKRINLKWFKDDAAYAREIYCYDLFRRYNVWSAPQASYCRLTIYVSGDEKPAYFGVYAMIENIDEQYLAARKDKWGADTGFLWKGGWAGNDNANFVSTSSIGVEDVKLDASLSKYYAYDLKTRDKELTTAKTQLIDFIQELNTRTGADFEQWIEQKVDVEQLLKAYAVNVMVGMWDDYWANGNNFYFYFNGSGKGYFIPYDYDNTLGTSLFFNAGTQDLLRWGNMAERPLITKILEIEKWRNFYKDALKELADPTKSYFYVTDSQQRISNWQNFVQPYVSNDTGEDMMIGDYPAWWGNAPFYRLFNGNDEGGANGPANFFTTKQKQVNW
jgi:spore coat protein H